ncbi:MAG: hypothetical protein AAFO93_14770 [Pseudomonadota bacterium]
MSPSNDLSDYAAQSGRFEAAFTLEIQTLPGDVGRILDAVMAVHPLSYGRYERNASVTAQGYETARPMAGSTTDTHVESFQPGGTETYPMVELKISVERDATVLARVMDAILSVHHYEEPVIFCREDWVHRAAYDPDRENPNRWWNRDGGLPDRLEDP